MWRVLSQFRWVDGHADVWRVFRDPASLASVVNSLAAPYRSRGVTTVAGVESRGFLLGGAVAVSLGVGFTAVRKPGGLFPGPKARVRTSADYRGNTHELAVQRASLGPSDRVLLVDDWIETGSQATAVQSLVKSCGATMVGIAVMIDGLAEELRPTLPPVHCIAKHEAIAAD